MARGEWHKRIQLDVATPGRQIDAEIPLRVTAKDCAAY